MTACPRQGLNQSEMIFEGGRPRRLPGERGPQDPDNDGGAMCVSTRRPPRHCRSVSLGGLLEGCIPNSRTKRSRRPPRHCWSVSLGGLCETVAPASEALPERVTRRASRVGRAGLEALQGRVTRGVSVAKVPKQKRPRQSAEQWAEPETKTPENAKHRRSLASLARQKMQGTAEAWCHLRGENAETETPEAKCRTAGRARDNTKKA